MVIVPLLSSFHKRGAQRERKCGGDRKTLANGKSRDEHLIRWGKHLTFCFEHQEVLPARSRIRHISDLLAQQPKHLFKATASSYILSDLFRYPVTTLCGASNSLLFPQLWGSALGFRLTSSLLLPTLHHCSFTSSTRCCREIPPLPDSCTSTRTFTQLRCQALHKGLCSSTSDRFLSSPTQEGSHCKALLPSPKLPTKEELCWEAQDLMGEGREEDELTQNLTQHSTPFPILPSPSRDVTRTGHYAPDGA